MAYTIQYGDTLNSIARRNGVSVQQLLAANPGITDPNKIYAGKSLNLPGAGANTAPTPAVKPTAPTAPATPAAPVPPATGQQKTIGEVANSLVPDMPAEDPQLASYYQSQGKLVNDQVDEAAIRKQTMERYGTQFDAIRAAAAQKAAEFKRLGQNQLGQNAAMQARAGVIGSNFQTAENDRVNASTNELINAANAEAEAKIAFLMGEAEEDVSAQYAAKQDAIKQGMAEYQKYLATRDSARQEGVSKLAKLFAAQGIDVTQLSADDIKKLEKSYGISAQALQAEIQSAKMADKNAFFELSDGESRYQLDPVTGKAVLLAENTKNFAPSKYNSAGRSIAGGGAGGTGGSGGTGSSSTKLAYDDPNYLNSVINASKGGRRLTQSEAEPLTKMKRVVGQASTISQLIGTIDTGPIQGIIKSNNPYDTKARLLQANVTALVPTLARGVYGEVGVLTDTDVDRYTKTIASLKNTEDVNKAVMAMTLDIAAKSMAAQLESMAAAGRDVSGFYNMYNDINTKVNTLKSQLEAKTQQATAPTTKNVAGMVRMKSPDGRIIQVPADKVKQALANRYVQL